MTGAVRLVIQAEEDFQKRELILPEFRLMLIVL